MKYHTDAPAHSINQSDGSASAHTLERQNENLHFFRRLLESLFRVDTGDRPMCTCRSLNRNNNASSDGDDDETSGNNQSRPQLYSHMRKVYDRDTALLEHVYITMSTARPQHCIHDVRLESITQRRRRPTRVSKQRAKVLITEYCSQYN